jgi:hypothetical protein
MKAVGDADHLGDRPLKPDHPKQARPAQHGQSIQRVVPEGRIVGEGFEWFEEPPGLGGRVLLPQGCRHFPHEIAKPDRVLLIFGMPPVSRLVERETRRLVRGQELDEHFVREHGHCLVPFP